MEKGFSKETAFMKHLFLPSIQQLWKSVVYFLRSTFSKRFCRLHTSKPLRYLSILHGQTVYALKHLKMLFKVKIFYFWASFSFRHAVAKIKEINFSANGTRNPFGNVVAPAGTEKKNSYWYHHGSLKHFLKWFTEVFLKTDFSECIYHSCLMRPFTTVYTSQESAHVLLD